MANITWDIATATATLSGGNLVATSNSTTNQGARGADATGKTTGKYYFEITLTTKAGGGNSGFGIGTTTSTYASMGSNATTGVNVYVGGSIYDNGSNVLSLNPLGLNAGEVIGIAVDLDNRAIWFRQWANAAGSWNQYTGSGKDPATNVGGLTIPAGTMVPWCTSNATGNVYTANFGNSAFSGAVPSGYTAGWPTVALNYVDLAGNLGGVFSYGKLAYGVKKYSRINVFAPAFSADLSLLAFTPVDLAGGLAPTIVLAADLDVHVNLIELAGSIAPQIALGGALSLDLPLTALDGSFGFSVVLAASGLVSGPLWVAEEPVASPWEDSEPCPPPAWMITPPCDSVVWSKSGLCNG